MPLAPARWSRVQGRSATSRSTTPTARTCQEASYILERHPVVCSDTTRRAPLSPWKDHRAHLVTLPSRCLRRHRRHRRCRRLMQFSGFTDRSRRSRSRCGQRRRWRYCSDRDSPIQRV